MINFINMRQFARYPACYNIDKMRTVCSFWLPVSIIAINNKALIARQLFLLPFSEELLAEGDIRYAAKREDGDSAKRADPLLKTVGNSGEHRKFRTDCIWNNCILANCRKRQDAKPQGLRSSIRYVSLAANSISKPPETAGRKVMGAKAETAMPARLLIQLANHWKQWDAKLWGLRCYGTKPARPPETLHPCVTLQRKEFIVKILKDLKQVRFYIASFSDDVYKHASGCRFCQDSKADGRVGGRLWNHS